MSYYQNFNKRLVKTPKLYFYDSGLVSHLLGLDNAQYLQMHATRGALFEGFVIAECMKYFLNKGKRPSLYFWRDHSAAEIDLLIEQAGSIKAVEIKSSSTFQPNMLKSLEKWKPIDNVKKYLVYSGQESYQHKGISIIPWQGVESILK